MESLLILLGVIVLVPTYFIYYALFSDSLKADWRRALKRCKTADVVQLHFREGLVGPDIEKNIAQMLTETIPVPVVFGGNDLNGKNILTIFVDKIEKNHYDERNLTPILAKSALRGVAAGIPLWIFVWAQEIVFIGPIATMTNATVKYQKHKDFLKDYGFLPYRFSAVAAYGKEKMTFDDVMNESHFGVMQYDLIEMPAAKQRIDADADDMEIINVSLQAWVQSIAIDLNKYKIGSKVKPATNKKRSEAQNI
jgi:hypothetical protein